MYKAPFCVDGDSTLDYLIDALLDYNFADTAIKDIKITA